MIVGVLVLVVVGRSIRNNRSCRIIEVVLAIE